MISRLSHEAQAVRGWYITITVALCTGIILTNNHGLYRITVVETLLFFLMELTYSVGERRYRDLYKETARKSFEKIDYSMEPEKHLIPDYLKATIRPINLLYLVVFIFSSYKSLIIK